MALRTEELGLISCFPERLYNQGGFHDDPSIRLRDLRSAGAAPAVAEWVDEVFPGYARERNEPAHIDGPDAAFIDTLLRHYRAIAAGYVRGPATGLIRFSHAYVSQSVVYAPRGGRLRVVYETYRQNDRTAVQLQPSLEPPARPGRVYGADGRPCMYLGSAGSFNYGHWLIDDLPRIKATEGLDVTYLLPSYGEPIDRVRIEGLRRFTDAPTEWVNPLELIACENLLYVTPVSFHPVLKSPEALAYVRDRFSPLARPDPGRRLFVVRNGGRSRALVNVGETAAILRARGFIVLDPEALSFSEQVAMFLSARCVVGEMGAAMANTVFCKPGTPVVHLAPSGWVEPFYWDLAEVLGQPYSALYGAVDDPAVPAHTAGFSIDPVRLETLLDAAIGG